MQTVPKSGPGDIKHLRGCPDRFDITVAESCERSLNSLFSLNHINKNDKFDIDNDNNDGFDQVFDNGVVL